MGQVRPDSHFGQAITDVASQWGLHTFCEVGTWNGQGTTICLYNALRTRPGTRLYSVEGNLGMYTQAKSYWNGVTRINLLYGTLHRDILSRQDVINHPRFPLVKDHYELYYADEEEAVLNAPLVQVPPCDVILLDGGEFSTQGDWNALYHDNLKVVILDDTQVIKTHSIYNHLLQSPNWKCTHNVPHDRNGWAIFMKR